MTVGQQMTQWCENTKKQIEGKCLVTEDHKPTPNERNNLVHLCFTNIFGYTFRHADLAVIEAMSPEIKTVKDLKSEYVPIVAEYVWDHWMGEPEDPQLQDVQQMCEVICDALYTLPEDIRNDIKKQLRKQWTGQTSRGTNDQNI